jgi:AcrR family transcriptional regulator
MPKRPDGGLIWARPEPGVRKPRFSREKIAAAALEIADTEGIEAVSMRRVAGSLGAAAMALYNYVRTKDDLLALMHDAIMGEVLVPDEDLPQDWRAAVTVIARRVRDVLVRHPWAVAMQEVQPGPNAMRRFEQFLGAVSDSGLDTAQKLDLLAVLNAYVFGNALITVESRMRAEYAAADPSAVEEIMGFAAELMQSGEFPNTAELLAEGQGAQIGDTGEGGASGGRGAASPPLEEDDVEQQFLRGLEAVLDGLVARFAAAPRPEGAAGA